MTDALDYGYEQAFRDNAIDAEVLPALTDADLEKRGTVLAKTGEEAEAASWLEQAIKCAHMLEALAGDALIGSDEQDAPADLAERRRRFGRSWEVAGRVSVRASDAPPSTSGLPELVIDSPAGAFGTGAHPTTRMCLELLLDLEPGGGFGVEERNFVASPAQFNGRDNPTNAGPDNEDGLCGFRHICSLCRKLNRRHSSPARIAAGDQPAS